MKYDWNSVYQFKEIFIKELEKEGKSEQAIVQMQ